MRVLHVIPSVGPMRGGPSVALRVMVQGLARAGVYVDVVTTDDNGNGRLDVPYSRPITEYGVNYRFFPRQIGFYTFSWPLTLWLAQHVKEYDLVHIHALFSYAAIPAAYWASRSGVPYIVRPLGVLNRWGMRNRRPWLKKISLSLVEKKILRGAAAVHYTSEQERSEAAQLGIGEECVVISNAVDVPIRSSGVIPGSFRRKHRLLADRIVVLFLSRVHPVKGLHMLLPAFARVWTEHSRARLVVAGNGEADYLAHLQQEAARLEILPHILWVGFLSGEEKWAALADADIFVLPSESENFGMAAVEAMACGVPVVVTDRVGIQREIAQAQAGLVISRKTEELTKALSVLIADPQLRADMGLNGRRLAREKFTSGATTERVIALYRDICEPRRGRLEQAAG